MNVKKLGVNDILNLFDDIQEIDKTLNIDVEQWNLDSFLFDLPEKWNLSRLAFDNSKLIGYLICSKKDCNFHIHRLVVSTNYQNKGIGSLLLSNLLDSLPKNSYLTLKVKKHNFKAIAFYEKKGFRRLDEEDVNYLYRKIV